MGIDITAEYGYGIILSREEFEKIKEETTAFGRDEDGEYEEFPFEEDFVRINCYTDDTEYFFGISMLSAEAGYADTDLRVTEQKDLEDLYVKIEKINKILDTNYKAMPCVYCILW